MDADSDRSRLLLALLVAPLAAPLAMELGWLVYGLVTISIRPSATAQHPGPLEVVAGIWFFGYVFMLLGAPLAYAATLLVVLPLFLLLRAADRLTWWLLTLVASLAGGALLPLYMHWLNPRGSTDFYPGAGFLAGAAAGWAFWYLATRRRPSRATE
jgi:hypothetical protein